ncbi:MAG: signal peptidase II [Bdellovibrionaceae bacterium]|nr:signal peptidase II [Pseudobdellovibrionaceae bacterium]
MRKYLYLISVSGFIIALDQLVKIYVHTSFKLGESVPVIQNIFHITYVRNFGAAFGLLSESHPAFREAFFLVMPPVALIVILVILRRVQNEKTAEIIALAAVFGGAVGNYIDRLRFRYVIDYLDFHWYGKYSFPAFNIADSSIVCGVAVIFISLLLENRLNKKNIENVLELPRKGPS